jgi:hypothetical protein
MDRKWMEAAHLLLEGILELRLVLATPELAS